MPNAPTDLKKVTMSKEGVKYTLAMSLGFVFSVLANDLVLHWDEPIKIAALTAAMTSLIDALLWFTIPVIKAIRAAALRKLDQREPRS